MWGGARGHFTVARRGRDIKGGGPTGCRQHRIYNLPPPLNNHENKNVNEKRFLSYGPTLANFTVARRGRDNKGGGPAGCRQHRVGRHEPSH